GRGVGWCTLPVVGFRCDSAAEVGGGDRLPPLRAARARPRPRARDRCSHGRPPSAPSSARATGSRKPSPPRRPSAHWQCSGGARQAGDADAALTAGRERGQESVDVREDCVVTASGAPADILVGLEVLGGPPFVVVGDEGAWIAHALMTSWSASWICPALEGR